ncbi:MAG: hypothetical protein IMY67_11070 [Bacteroidetes bacterium]|nr:hypothetical protein [Bacteroidota bacterium]
MVKENVQTRINFNLKSEAKTQLEEVRLHLETYGHLTSLDAINSYGITRLSDKIYKLRRGGWK